MKPKFTPPDPAVWTNEVPRGMDKDNRWYHFIDMEHPVPTCVFFMHGQYYNGGGPAQTLYPEFQYRSIKPIEHPKVWA
jgi:hypothetical protein